MKINNLIVSPLSHGKLKKRFNRLYDGTGNVFKIVKDVPVLLPQDQIADWHRELIEVILWEYPDEIEKIYFEPEWKSSPVSVYIKYIEKILKNKQGILHAIEKYSNDNTQKWIINSNHSVVTKAQILKFKKYSKKNIGKMRTDSKIDARGIFTPYPYFSELVNSNSPRSIVELGMGAGGGTASISLNMDKDCVLFAIDIGFECLGNAFGIKKYQKKNIVPICANFWSLPFIDGSIDSVCTFNGLDESREINKTIFEVQRILKSGGKFTVVSRKNAFMRQSSILAPFGFTENEVVELLRKCRVYTDINNLYEICENNSLKIENYKEFVINDNLTYIVSQFIKK